MKDMDLLRKMEALDLDDDAPIEKDAPVVSAFDSEGKQRKQSDVLIDIGRSHDLFHDHTRNAYARIGRAVYSMESAAYREVLAESFLNIAGKGCNRNALGDAVTTLASLAKYRGDCRPAFLRVGGNRDRIVIDTGSVDHTFIEVTATGWRPLEDNLLMFKRVGGMLPLPKPAAPDFARLWNYITVTEHQRPLIAGFMLGSLCPTGPYPTLHVSGEQGTGKSTQARVIKRLTDPNVSALRAPPKEVRDLLVGALNGWMLSIDNLSGINPQLSDALCRLSTGGAISERALYSNTDEVLVEVQRPIILNGIEDIATRPDLAERGIHIELEAITHRRTESEYWAAFEADAPHIFAALLDGLVAAVRDHDELDLGRLPRMADFAKWAAAGMAPLGFTPSDFMDAYRENIADGQTASVDSSPVGQAIVRLMESRDQWQGTASDLMEALAHVSDDAVTRMTHWPKTARWMAGSVTRLAPALRARGIDVTRPPRTADGRLIALCKRGILSSSASLASPNDGNDGNDDKKPGLHDWEDRL